jgi:RNA processing factor Prp31
MIASSKQQENVQNMFYFARDLILIIKEIEEITSKRKYLTQRKWVDYCTQRTVYMREVIEKVWFWIEKDDSWKNFHKFFKNFEKDYLIIMSIVRQTRDLQKMIDEVMNHIAEWWKFNFRVFKELRLHTLKAIKKCARADYIMKETLKMLKLIVVFRLRNSRRDIFISILSNASDWARIIDDVFENETMTIQKMRELNLLNRKSFFSRQKLELAFSSFISRAIIMIMMTFWLMRWV